MKFQNIILGGTFDLLHDGHKALLNKAFEVGEKVWIGITVDKFRIMNYELRIAIQNLELRKKELEDYLKVRGWLSRAKMIEIDDKYGTTLTDSSLQAIVVSPETYPVAQKINQLRQKKHWQPLQIIKIDWVLAEDNKPINSIRIRNGEIDRSGQLFRLPKNWGKRYLPENLRQEFKKPMGRLVSHLSHLSDLKMRKIIAIGDATVANLLKNNIVPDISIIDLKIHRQVVYQNVEELGFRDIKLLKKVKNESGTLSFESYSVLLELIRSEAKPAVMQIDGEDDLLTLLAVFLAPLDSLIVYGQPYQGLVIIEVSEEQKTKAGKYLAEFKKSN